MSMEALKARHRLAWGLAVDAYVRHTVPEFGPVADLLIEMANPEPGSSLLDLACGPGTVALRAAARVGPNGRVVGVDLAQPMVAYAEKQAKAQGTTNVTFAVGDVEDLEDLTDASFDVVLSNFGAIFAPEPERMVGELARVTKPGGTIALSVWVPVGMVAETCAFMASVLPPLPDGAARYESWGEPGVAVSRLESHFEDLTTTDVPVQVEHASVDQAWLRMREGRPPFALAYGRMSMDEKHAAEQRAREMFRKYADPSGKVSYERAAGIVRGVRKA